MMCTWILAVTCLFGMSHAFFSPVRPTNHYPAPRYDSCRDTIEDLKALVELTQSLKSDSTNATPGPSALSEDIIIKLVNALIYTATQNCGFNGKGTGGIPVNNGGHGGNTGVTGGGGGTTVGTGSGNPGGVIGGGNTVAGDGSGTVVPDGQKSNDEGLINLDLLGKDTAKLDVAGKPILVANIGDHPGSAQPSSNPNVGLGKTQQTGATTDANQGLLGGVGSALGNTLGGVGDTLGNTLGGVGDTLGNTLGGVGDTLGNTLGGVGDALGNTLGGVGDTLGNTLGGVGNTLGGITNGVGGVLGGESTKPVTGALPETSSLPVNTGAVTNNVATNDVTPVLSQPSALPGNTGNVGNVGNSVVNQGTTTPSSVIGSIPSGTGVSNTPATNATPPVNTLNNANSQSDQSKVNVVNVTNPPSSNSSSNT